MDDLSNRLRAARRGAAPHQDLWPAVDARIRMRPSRRWTQAAAAALLFAAGTLTGMFIQGDRGTGPPGGWEGAGHPMHAAAAVQRAGSEYLAAVAALRELRADDEPLRAQAYEAALAVVAVTAEEVTTALDLRDDGGLAGRAREAHADASRRTAALLGGGAE